MPIQKRELCAADSMDCTLVCGLSVVLRTYHGTLFTRSFFATLSPTAQRYLAAVRPVERAETPSDPLPDTDTQFTQSTPSTVTRVSRIVKSTSVSRSPEPSSDPFQRTGVPALPVRGTNPSDGVAHRLALAREQARLRSSQRHGSVLGSTDASGSRLASRALARSSTAIGSARRVAVPRAETPSTPRTKPVAASASKTSSPFTMRSEFTPKRRPFNVVNEDRSPQNRVLAQDAHAHVDE